MGFFEPEFKQHRLYDLGVHMSDEDRQCRLYSQSDFGLDGLSMFITIIQASVSQFR